MKKYPDTDIKRAIALRKKHTYSFAQLYKITGIPGPTIRNWCKHKYVGTRWDVLLKTNERKRHSYKNSEVALLNTISLSRDLAKLLVAFLYWCEGAKYPATNKLSITNSDPQLLVVFMHLVRSAFTIDESKFRISIQLHDNQNYGVVQQFWSTLLAIDPKQFIRPTITKARENRKHRNDYMGTCTVAYSDYRLQLTVIGLYEMFAKKIPEIDF